MTDTVKDEKFRSTLERLNKISFEHGCIVMQVHIAEVLMNNGYDQAAKLVLDRRVQVVEEPT